MGESTHGAAEQIALKHRSVRPARRTHGPRHGRLGGGRDRGAADRRPHPHRGRRRAGTGRSDEPAAAVPRGRRRPALAPRLQHGTTRSGRAGGFIGVQYYRREHRPTTPSRPASPAPRPTDWPSRAGCRIRPAIATTPWPSTTPSTSSRSTSTTSPAGRPVRTPPPHRSCASPFPRGGRALRQRRRHSRDRYGPRYRSIGFASTPAGSMSLCQPDHALAIMRV
jgi:hypothetical protein